MTINEPDGGREDEEKRRGEGRAEGAMGKEDARLKAGNCERMGRAGGNA